MYKLLILHSKITTFSENTNKDYKNKLRQFKGNIYKICNLVHAMYM